MTRAQFKFELRKTDIAFSLTNLIKGYYSCSTEMTTFTSLWCLEVSSPAHPQLLHSPNLSLLWSPKLFDPTVN